MGWLIGLGIAFAAIRAYYKTKKYGPPTSRFSTGTKIGAAGVAGYVIGKKILKP